MRKHSREPLRNERFRIALRCIRAEEFSRSRELNHDEKSFIEFVISHFFHHAVLKFLQRPLTRERRSRWFT